MKLLAYLSTVGWFITIILIASFSSPAGAAIFSDDLNQVSPVLGTRQAQGVEDATVGEEDETIEAMIVRISREHGFDEKTALRIAWCESRFKPEAKNAASTATGLYQFTRGTWEWIGAEANGLDRLNPEHSLSMFLKWYPKNKNWWLCQ